MSVAPARTEQGWISWGLAILVGLVAVGVFGIDLRSEPHFVDESAFLSQSYFADLFIDGRHDVLEWLTYPAIDLPPLPKYLIGLTLRAAGHPRPGPEDARAWYLDTSRRFVGAEALTRARWPSVVCGALGCVALYGLGALGGDRRVGMVAAGFLTVNPLYRLHARRAMADVPAECLILLTAVVGLWVWRRSLQGRFGFGIWLGTWLVGVLGGLAVLAKLNGGLGLIWVWALTILGLILPGLPAIRKLGLVTTSLVASLIGFLTFTVLNPTLTAKPAPPVPEPIATLARASIVERAAAIVRHRVEVSREGQALFPHNALRSLPEKFQAVLVQGFGRFGPLGPARSDSTARYDRRQDWGMVVWLPLVVSGGALLFSRGFSDEERPPTSWALLAMCFTALIIVTGFIPLAWDRYFLSIQPGCSLLGAITIVAALDLARAKLNRPAGNV
jgi:4-amino-4-deoxy-L-arabinose transferase-like glycosyltransferase